MITIETLYRCSRCYAVGPVVCIEATCSHIVGDGRETAPRVYLCRECLDEALALLKRSVKL